VALKLAEISKVLLGEKEHFPSYRSLNFFISYGVREKQKEKVKEKDKVLK
jgi:hypothetical protein